MRIMLSAPDIDTPWEYIIISLPVDAHSLNTTQLSKQVKRKTAATRSVSYDLAQKLEIIVMSFIQWAV